MNDTDDDKSLFRKRFGTIERIHSDRVEQLGPCSGKRPIDTPPAGARTGTPISPHPDLSLAGERCIDDYHFRGGIRDRLFRRLRRGQLPVADSIDLHGMSREVALDRLQRFVPQARLRGAQCILVIHGKGLSSGHQAVLRPSVPVWLRQMPGVLAYCPALPRHGGDGALYVLLSRGHGRVR